MGYSASGIAIDAIIETQTIFKWDAVKDGVNANYRAKAGTWASTGAGPTNWIGDTVQNTATGTINDEIGLGSFFIPTDGIYTIDILGVTGGESGISHVLIDSVDKGTIDWYGVGSNNARLTGSLTLTKGAVAISLKMASKNASSTAYRLYLQSVIIHKT